MSNEPNERPPGEQEAETATPGAIGALDGAAAVGSRGGESRGSEEEAMPTEAPDPSVGPD